MNLRPSSASVTKAVCAIATLLVVVGLWLVTTQHYAAQRQSSAYINVSGRQRMLSQRIALLAEKLREADVNHGTALERELKNTLHQFESNYQALLHGSAEHGLTLRLSPAAVALLEDEPHHLGAKVEVFLRLVHAALENGDEQPRIVHLDSVVAAGLESDLLPTLDAFVGLLEQEATSNAIAHEWLLLVLVVAAIVCVTSSFAILVPLKFSATRDRPETRKRETLKHGEPTAAVEAPRVSKWRVAAYPLLILALVGGYAWLETIEWTGSSSLHSIIEAVATLTALFVAALALVRYYTRRNNMILLIGVGFLGTGLLDGYHMVVTSEWFVNYFPTVPSSLIPWSWNASRTFLGLMMLISFLGWRREQELGSRGQLSDAAVYGGAGLLTCLSFCIFAFVPLGRAYFPELYFGRPQELIPCVLFAAALAGYASKSDWRHEALDYWILASLLVGLLAQGLFMPRSFVLFDSMFDAAHLLKIFSYLLLLVGLLCDVYSTWRREQRMTSELRDRMDEILDQRMQIVQSAIELEGKNDKLRKSEQDAQAANEAKSQFLANMSHEIRTPMTAILGYCGVLLEDGDVSQSTEQRDEAIQTIRRNGEHLLTVINDVLDLSKIEAGKFQIEDLACSPHELLRDVAQLMQVRADAKGLNWKVELQSALPLVVTTDPTRLRQILINLVGNAIKFTETGSVKLTARTTQECNRSQLVFDVVDTGIGMSLQQQQSLFRPFQQADNSTSRRFGGTGLGLTISQRFAEMLGGDITVSSETGAGSTFSLTIDVGPLEGVETSDNLDYKVHDSAPQNTTVETPLRGLNVLLVEDGPDNQRLISFFVKKAGATVTIAENGLIGHDAALDAVQQGRPFDMILMDMQMPVMDGYTATRGLRGRGYKGPVIALTANAMAEDRQKCLDAGCDDFATKPIDREKLIGLIGQLAGTNEMSRQYAEQA